jgi:GT2 family glycosyltransferase
VNAPRIAVIVLNYNGRELTLQALESVCAMNGPGYDVVVVDNGSSDGSCAAIAEAFPQVALVRTEVNLGAAGGYNLGMRWAAERRYDYLLILNNDVECHPELLCELVAVAEADPTIGAVGPKTYYYWERERIWSAGGLLRFRESVTRERGDGEVDRGQFDRDQEMGYLNGCGMLIRRQALEAAGLWDPLFHLSVEDADWCLRVRRAGFRCLYAHRAILYHMVARSTGVYHPARTYHTGRSTALFVRRYARPWQWASFLFFTALAIPAAFLRELPRGNQGAAVAKLRGVIDGLRAPMTSPPRLQDGPAPQTVTSAGALAGAAHSSPEPG